VAPEHDSVALVHDYLLVLRGAERSFAAISDCFPEASIYTLLYDRTGTEDRFAHRRVHPSGLQRLGVRQHTFRPLLPLFPSAVERLPVGHAKTVISSTSAFAHGVRPGLDAVHIAYCHSPFRYAWHAYEEGVEETPRVLRPLVRRTLRRIRRWDIEASTRVTHYIANSELTRQRIREYYGRDAGLIHPPVQVHRFSPGEPEDFFLVVTEVVRHKRVEDALEAARRAGLPITVVGGGPDLDRLAGRYGSSATFLGRVSDSELTGLYRRARALVVPNIEEFGIAAVEAQASGRPVLGVDAGGLRETVAPGVTGVLVPPGDVDALAEAMATAAWDSFDPARVRAHAMQFSEAAFRERFAAEVARLSRPEEAGRANREPHTTRGPR
jgi:glycosyltransferase involved in cell wall biosynthesis